MVEVTDCRLLFSCRCDERNNSSAIARSLALTPAFFAAALVKPSSIQSFNGPRPTQGGLAATPMCGVRTM